MKPKEALIHFEEHLCKHCCEWNKSLRHCNTCPTDAAKKALEKQIPTKPIYSDYDDNGFGEIIPYTAICPICGYEFEFGTWNENHHCVCGQAMDWSDGNDE